MPRKPALSPDQLGFTFDAPSVPTGMADLAGLDRMVAAGIALALKEDRRSRREIAAAVSNLLDEDVTSMMLDAYSSEARANHNAPLHRALAIITATNRFDILDKWVTRIGARLLVGDEIKLARLGDLDRQMAALKQERKALEREAKPLKRDKSHEAK